MMITVILCTYNRHQMLRSALESLMKSILPDAVSWDVLVVDNNSSDATRSVVEDFCRRYPNRLRYLFEPRQGKSYALNSGIRAARGSVLAFVDDDVTVEPTWLQSLTADLHSGQWAGAGGRIVPKWQRVRPSWFPEKSWFGMAPLVIFDLDLEAGPLNRPPFGTNMAFQRRVFEVYGAFRTDLGPRPNSEIRNEDTEFGVRLLTAGEKIKYEPMAVVYHSVSDERLQRKYFLTWWFDKGRAEIWEKGTRVNTVWVFAGVPLHLLRRIVIGTLRWIFAIVPSQRFTYKLTVWLLSGTMIESWRRSKEIKKRHKLARV